MYASLIVSCLLKNPSWQRWVRLNDDSLHWACFLPSKHVSETHCNAWYLFAQRQISCADLIMGVLIIMTKKNFFGQNLRDI